jgi:hypothetical protein
MPILSIYFGMSEVSLLYFDNPENLRVYNYPFSIFSQPQSLPEFLKIVEKELKIDINEYELLISGFPYVPEVPGNLPKPVLSATIEKIIPSTMSFSGFLVNRFTLITPRSYVSGELNIEAESFLSNYLSNLSIYPHMGTVDPLDTYTLDNYIRFNNLSIPESVPVVFTGERFSKMHDSDPFTYLLMLDLIKQPGVHEIRRDIDNVFINLALLSIYDKKYTHLLLEHDFVNVGTILNLPGGAECLLESEDGTTQFIEVKEEELFIIPTLRSSNNRAVIKSPTLGSMERYLRGGNLGLIVDTRSKCSPELFNRDYIEKNFKIWINNIEEVLNSL